jgi:alkyl hydroperoxide reductase subunit AhpC
MGPLAHAMDARPPRPARMLTVGEVIPEFRLPALAATVGNGWEFDSAWLRGRWVALLYWPKQSCLESATDVAELASMAAAFSDRETQFVAASAAIVPDRREGRPQRRFASELPFPVLVDVRGDLAIALGLDAITPQRLVRATFVADPAGVVRWMSVSDLSAVRSLREAAEALHTARGGAVSPGRVALPSADAPPPAAERRLIRACAWCRRLKDDEEWLSPEAFIRRRTASELTHGICCECLRKQSPR